MSKLRITRALTKSAFPGVGCTSPVFLRASILNKGNIKRELKVGPLYAS